MPEYTLTSKQLSDMQAFLFKEEPQHPFCWLATLPPCETLSLPPFPLPVLFLHLFFSHVFSQEKAEKKMKEKKEMENMKSGRAAGGKRVFLLLIRKLS